jgi:hypothetical protein
LHDIRAIDSRSFLQQKHCGFKRPIRSDDFEHSNGVFPMPRIIEIQKIWLRDHKRDLHLTKKDTRSRTDGAFEYEYVSPATENKLPVALDEWLRRKMPETPIGIVWPHVRNEPIEGGWLAPYVDFYSEGLARYIAEWENIDQRACATGFRRETFEYAKWRTKLSMRFVRFSGLSTNR